MSKRQREKQKHAAPAQPTGPMAVAARWPMYEVLVSRSWQDTTRLVTILVARRTPDTGKVAAAYFLVDLACLGVKSVQVKRFVDVAEYTAALRTKAMETQPLAPADLDLAAKILYTAIEYAQSLGFQPDFVFAQAEPLLSGAEPARCVTPVPVGGPEGKPFFVNGPFDNVDRVLATLRRTVGEGNFVCLIQSGSNELEGYD